VPNRRFKRTRINAIFGTEIIILGRLGDKLGGGVLTLRKDLAEDALSKLADQLGMSLEEVAFGIIKLANTVMAKALRIVTVERGYDPRDFTMFVFGGAGGLHGVELAEELNVRSVLIPPHAGVFSALGLLLSDYRADKIKSVMMPADNIHEDEIEMIYLELVNSAVEEVRVENAEIKVVKQIDLRYKGQAYEITVPWLGNIEECVKVFHEKHEALYGFSSPDESVEVVNLRVTAIGIMHKPEMKAEKEVEHEPRPEYYREVYFDNGWMNTPIYIRSKLKAGAIMEGPAVIEDYDTTIVIPPNYTAFVDGYSNIRVVRD
jgi:N-methylhydantoinase A